MTDHTQAQTSHPDVIVIGGGMGGATAAHRLAREGRSVVIIEKGLSEPAVDSTRHESDPQLRMQIGVWPTKMRTCIDGKTVDAWSILGCGLGGSSLHYGATLQRFEPDDFAAWPINYEELEPFYQEAESLFRVHGSPDPLSSIPTGSYQMLDPLPMNNFDRRLYNALSERGLHPYRLHMALAEDSSGQGRGSGEELYLNAKQACLDPLIATGEVEIVDQAEAVELGIDEGRVTHVAVETLDGRRVLKARYFILAAGALATPRLLMNSRSEQFPRGIGNAHDLVGRNLMFHASDFIAIWPPGREKPDGLQKAMAFRDFYEVDGTKYGEVQSMGFPTSPGDILQYLHGFFWRSPLRHIPVLRHVLRIPAFIGAKLFREAAVYSSILEDYPYPENRLVLDETAPGGISIFYEMKPELKDRVHELRALLKDRLGGLRSFRLNQNIVLNLGHPCGTCRAGTSAANSVVDGSFRLHGVDNLYLGDASVFTSSGATNPSLTVAACALRCAAAIIADEGESTRKGL